MAQTLMGLVNERHSSNHSKEGITQDDRGYFNISFSDWRAISNSNGKCIYRIFYE